MSTRTTLRPQVVIAAGDMSAASITSAPTILQSLTIPNYSVTWTGSTPVGVIQVQASDDYALNPDGTVSNAGTWNPLPLSVAGSSTYSIPVTGNTGNGMIDIYGLGAYAIRLVYVKTSGTGTLTAIINGKVA